MRTVRPDAGHRRLLAGGADDPRRRRPDIGLAQRLLGWSPTVDLQQGLEATIPYFAGQIGGDRPLFAFNGTAAAPLLAAAE